MTVLELIMAQVQNVIELMKTFDIWYGVNLWQLVLLFISLTDLTMIIKALFGGKITND